MSTNISPSPSTSASSGILKDATGSFIGSSVQKSSGISESKIASTSFNLLKTSADMMVVIKNQLNNFNQKLTNIERKLSKFFEMDIMKSIKQKIQEFKLKMNHYLNEDKKNEPVNPSAIGDMNKQLQNDIENGKIALEQKNTQKKVPEFDEMMLELNTAQDILTTDGMIVDDNQIDTAKLRTLAEISRNPNDSMKALEAFEQNHGNRLIEEVYQIQQGIYEISQGNTDSIVEKVTNNWHIQNAIRNVKVRVQKMMLDFNVGRDLQNCIDKLNESMSLLIGVYDRIDGYTEKQELVNYIANVASPDSQLTDDAEINAAICQLNKMIHTNLILERYEIAKNAFKQHTFPFAHCYMAKFEMPKNFQAGDVDETKKEAINKIKSLIRDLEIANISIEKYDKDIVTANPLTFYTWRYNEIRNDIEKLLRGEEITLKADIANGLNENAVKFKEIQICLKLKTEKMQEKLNAKLEKFKVSMTMVGNAYYRCGKRSYYMSVDDKIAINYSIKKNDEGLPETMNDVYKKIRNGKFFLSPYTMWTIQLDGDTNQLDEFRNEIIDLNLQGHGQYVKHSSNIEHEFAPNILDKYYNFNGIISFANNENLIDL